MLHALFYKYVPLSNLESLRESLHQEMFKHDIKGTILLSDEGINGAFTAQDKNFHAFLDVLRSYEGFEDVEFKITPVTQHHFRKVRCAIRQEIVSLRQEGVSLEEKAPYVEPETLKEWLDNDDVIIVDARNDYESRVGRFKGAITPDIKVFRDWPKAVEQLKKFKDKKIVTYCTGGIRCEKASAYMKAQGFENVYQLHGGIVKYGQVVGDEHWEGKCFVFDTRLVADIDPKKESDHITECEYSGEPCSTYHNCSNVQCDKYFIATEKEAVKHHGKCPSCSAHRDTQSVKMPMNS